MKAYDIGLKAYRQFLDIHCLHQVWPPPPSHVSQFVAYLSLTGKSWSTAKSYVAAIGFQCKIKNVTDVTGYFTIRKMLEGMRRLKHSCDSRLPITIELLTRIISALPSICSSTYETVMFCAAYSLAFFGFLRIGELTVLNNSDTSRVFTLSQIKVIPGKHIELTIPFSKTDQLGKGQTIVIQATGTQICPLLHVRNYLSQRPNFQGPFFCHFGGKPLTRFQFTSVLSKVLNSLGINTQLYKSHSFRIGAASLYHLKGESEENIKVIGRWKSCAYKSYIRIPHLKH